MGTKTLVGTPDPEPEPRQPQMGSTNTSGPFVQPQMGSTNTCGPFVPALQTYNTVTCGQNLVWCATWSNG